VSDPAAQPPNERPPAEPPPKEPLSVVRKIVAAIGILIMVLTGGCTILVAIPTLMYNDFSGLPLLLLFGGIPFLVGFWVFKVATTKPRRKD
jgi:hypothetical protein